MGETLEISRRTVKNTTRPGQHVGKHGSFRHGINFLLNFVRKTPFELLTRRFHKAEWILWTPFIKKKETFRVCASIFTPSCGTALGSVAAPASAPTSTSQVRDCADMAASASTPNRTPSRAPAILGDHFPLLHQPLSHALLYLSLSLI